MTDEKMILQLGSSVVEKINRLKSAYCEQSSEAVIARALGLLEQLEPYLEDGTLLVVDPYAPPRNDIVQLVFKNVAASALRSPLNVR